MDATDKPGRREIFVERHPQERLRAQGLAYMLQGAGYAAAVFAGVVLFIALLAALGRLLPEESRETPDASYGALPAALAPEAPGRA